MTMAGKIGMMFCILSALSICLARPDLRRESLPAPIAQPNLHRESLPPALDSGRTESDEIGDFSKRFSYRCVSDLPAFREQSDYVGCVKALEMIPKDKAPNGWKQKPVKPRKFVSLSRTAARGLAVIQPYDIFLGKEGLTWSSGQCKLSLKLVGDNNHKGSLVYPAYIRDKATWLDIRLSFSGMIQHCARGYHEITNKGLIPKYAPSMGKAGENGRIELSMHWRPPQLRYAKTGA